MLERVIDWINRLIPGWIKGLIGIAIGFGLLILGCGAIMTLFYFGDWLFWVAAVALAGTLILRNFDTALAKNGATVALCVGLAVIPQLLFVTAFNASINAASEDGEPLGLVSVMAFYERGIIWLHEKLDAIAEIPVQWMVFAIAVAIAVALPLKRPQIVVNALRARQVLRLTSLGLVAASAITVFSGIDSGHWSPNLNYRLELRLRERAQYVLEQEYALALTKLANDEPETITALADQVIGITKHECSDDHWMVSAEEAQTICAVAITDASIAVRDVAAKATSRAKYLGAAHYDQLKSEIASVVLDVRQERALAETLSESASSSVAGVLREHFSTSIFGSLVDENPLASAFSEEFVHRFVHHNAEQMAERLPLAKLVNFSRLTTELSKEKITDAQRLASEAVARLAQVKLAGAKALLVSRAMIAEARSANRALRYRFVAKTLAGFVKYFKKVGKVAKRVRL